MELIVSLIWAAAVAWLLLRAFRQRNLLPVAEPLHRPASPGSPTLSVIVPARNEAENIARCLEGLIGQNYPPDALHMFVVDDHSADATRSIAATMAERDPRLHILRAPSLPRGWIGKSHACWIGAREALPHSQWLCFMDADVAARPELLSSAVESASRHTLDLLSLSPRQELETFAERVIIPTGLYFLSFCQDLRRLQSPDCPDAPVTGQFLLIRASAYAAVGGHARVREEICEDAALARTVKRAGYRVALQDGRFLLSTRMYRNWRELWPGLTKNVVETLGGPAVSCTFALLAFVLAWSAWLIPLWDAAACAVGTRGACLAIPVATFASAAITAFHVAGAVYLGIPLWYGLIFPVGYTIGAAMVFDGMRRRLRGHIVWKGRTYP